MNTGQDGNENEVEELTYLLENVTMERDSYQQKYDNLKK